MTIKATINAGLVGGDRSASLDAYAARLYERPAPVMAVVELTPVDRVVPVDGASEKDPVVRLRIESLEVAPSGSQDEVLRNVARALYVSRTANGTLTGDDEIALAEQTLTHAAGLVGGHETARLRVVLDWVLTQVEKICDNDKHRDADRRRLLREALAKASAARDAGVQLEVDA